MKLPHQAPVDTWVWGTETLLWGFHPQHEFTFKVLEPKVGRTGCLSLQYHHGKSECWFCLRGVAWALIIVDGVVCTRLLRSGDVQLLPAGVIHRLMACTSDLQILEPSTPDKHASDKSIPKDVVRLHCVFGRDCESPRSTEEARYIELAVAATERAIRAVEGGTLPEEENTALLREAGAWSLSA